MLPAFTVVVLLSYFLMGVHSQSQSQVADVAPLGNIDVQVKIAGSDFLVRFAPERESSMTMAAKLCREQADKIGVTEQTLADCDNKVGNFLQSEVDKWVANRLLQIPIILNGNRFDVAFFPERDSVAATATKLCNDNAATLGLTTETFDGCATGVSKFLQKAKDDWWQEKTLQVPVTIDDKELELTFLPERQTARQVALNTCGEYQKLYGLEESLAPQCVSGVATFIEERINRWIASKILNVQVQFTSGTFPIQFIPERESTSTVARRFCFEKAKELQLTQETFNDACANPLNDFLAQQVENWVARRKLSVPIQVRGRSVQVDIFPERESPRRVAERFCVDNAEALGLTRENYVADCVVPLNRLLSDAARKWEAAQSQ